MTKKNLVKHQFSPKLQAKLNNIFKEIKKQNKKEKLMFRQQKK